MMLLPDYHLQEASPARSTGLFRLSDLVTAIRRNKSVIILGAVIGIVGGYGISLQIAPRFSAEAVLVAEPPSSRVDGVLGPEDPLRPVDPAATRTVVETVASMPVLVRAVNQLPADMRAVLADAAAPKSGALRSFCPADDAGISDGSFAGTIRTYLESACRWMTSPKAGDEQIDGADAESRLIAEHITRSLEIKNGGRSYVIQVRYTATDPGLATAVTNAIAQQFIALRVEQRKESNAQAVDTLKNKLASLSADLQKAEQTSQTLREQVRLQELRSGTLTEQQANTLMSELVAARIRRTQAEARIQAARTGLGRDGSAASEVLSSQLIQQLRQQEAELRRREAQLLETLGPNHPDSRTIRAQRAELNRGISIEISKVVASLEADATAAKAQEEGIVSTLRAQEQAIAQSAEAYPKLRRAEREAQALATVYEQFLSRQRELSGRQDFLEPDVRVLSPAEVPQRPNGPSKSLMLALGSIAGALAGMSVAIMRTQREKRTDPELLVEQARLNALDVGMIPRVRHLRSAPSHYVAHNPSSAFTEALHRIRAALQVRPDSRRKRTIAVTSPRPAEGKSAFCLAFAGAMALANETVVVVDCDLRRPKPTQLHIDLSRGQPLVGYADLGATLYHGERGHPNVVRFHSDTLNPHAVFSSLNFRALLETLSSSYEYVLLDTPPLSVASDALFAGACAGECILVTKWRDTPPEMVSAAVSDFRALGIEVVALVINQVEVASGPLGRYRPALDARPRVQEARPRLAARSFPVGLPGNPFSARKG
ncbi:hypothetical protein SAE02_03410 [Skermanella aerolata]|uniref:Tyrosine-protein kinase G-rich domain-containing protein n=1 Tax=Skermanella aerolata TaxID=393310 RepID=A0A512DIA0_9PROT|nr:polysaccharide biosynthesis tyrosine autokinase [Skermanella aerolata]KJB97793.1 hypothetical protein N826_02170 [Skermanella aerolata KACC 11604]GEO36193.1 hypothetical protein SAE02_03410 [Skermanella aerolata]